MCNFNDKGKKKFRKVNQIHIFFIRNTFISNIRDFKKGFFFIYSLIMETKTNDNFRLEQDLTTRKHSGYGFKLIDVSTDFDKFTKKLEKLNRLLKSGNQVTWDGYAKRARLNFEKAKSNPADSAPKDLQTVSLRLSCLQINT